VTNDQNSTNISGITVYDLFKHLWRWRKGIVTIAGVFFCFGVVISLLVPKIYQATAIILPPTAQGSSSNLALPKNLPLDISPDILGLGTNKKGEIDRYISILQSTKLQRAVIDSFHLIQHYGYKKKYFIEDVLKTARKNTKIFSSDEGAVSISVLDTSPRMAASMANFIVLMLDSINKEMARTHMGRKKEFLETRMMENRTALHCAEDSLIMFQNKKGIIEIKKQTEESIHAIGEVEARLLMAGMDFFIDSSKFSQDDARIKEKKADLHFMRTYLSTITSNKGNGVLLPITQISTNALSYERLLRSVTIMSTLDQYLTKEYEAARLEEKSTIPTVALLDSAFVPEKRTKPKRKLLVLLTTGIGLGVGILSSILFQALLRSEHSIPKNKGLYFLVKCARFLKKDP
jgi:tyrosine-protein kinase Etk/Wzc